jgi:hypothetical protein
VVARISEVAYEPLSDDKVDDNERGHMESNTDERKGGIQKSSTMRTFHGRLHMGCAELQNRRVQVRFLSHLPLESLNLSGLQPHDMRSVFRDFDPI